MSQLKEQMIEEAREIYKEIHPCGFGKRIEDCFTIIDNSLTLWFNTSDKSTHIVRKSLASI